MKPVIGIIPSIDDEHGIYFIHNDNTNAISKAGGIPLMIPYDCSERDVAQLIPLIDGLYLTGGNDIDPTLFGEEPHPQLGEINRSRDEFERMIIKIIIAVDKPILAVCRGVQILNIALKGTMYQDIHAQHRTQLIQHNQKAVKSHASHFVEVTEESLLHGLVGQNKIKVNSRHHQANRSLGEGLSVCGKSSDGIIEAIESKTANFVLGVQWHPENMIAKGDKASINIYEGFIHACK